MKREDRSIFGESEEERSQRLEELRRRKVAEEVRGDYEQRRRDRRPLEAKWQLNLNFLAGNQYLGILPGGELYREEPQFDWQQREVYNHIAPVVETRLAKLSRVKPSVSVRAEGEEESELQTARLASKIVRGAFEQLNLSELIDTATMWSETCGTSFYKVGWVNRSGNRTGVTEGARAMQGEPEISVCPPFEIFPDNLSAMSLSELKSLIHARAVHVSEIYDKWGVHVKPETVEIFDLEQVRNPSLSADRVRQGDYAVVIERYELPDGENPEGRLTIVCGDKLLYEGGLPYRNGAEGERGFPFVMQSAFRQTGCFFGTSVIERCIPVQRAYNAVKNRKHEFMNRLASGVLAVEDGSVDLDDLEEEGLAPGKVLVYRQGARQPAFLDPGRIPSDFAYEEDRLQSEFISLSGVSEISRNSKTPVSVTSGVALQLLIEQDDTRMSLTAEEIRMAVKQLGAHLLRLYKQFADGKRLGRAAGSDGAVEVFYFSSSDITCYEVVLDTENELSETPAQKKAMILDMFKLGLLSDENGQVSERMKYRILELLGYGSIEGAQELSAMQVKRSQRENVEGIAKGVMPSGLDDHAVHIEEHTKYMLSGEYENLDKARREKYERHLSEHRRLLEAQERAELERLRLAQGGAE